MKKEVYWLINNKESEEYKIYTWYTWYRSIGIEDFIKKVEEENEIVGIKFKDNEISFVLKEL